MTDRLMYNSFRCHTPWLSTEQRNKVLPKYILYVERRWLTLGENALLHEPRILTDKEYLEMKRQIFPNRITGCPILTDYLSGGVLNEIMKDETNAYLRTLREERKSPSKGFPIGTYVTQIKDGEGGVYRITEPWTKMIARWRKESYHADIRTENGGSTRRSRWRAFHRKYFELSRRKR
jgi:hypothetical protein